MELDTSPDAPLERLPAEILDLIILQPCLCNGDIKSIRLASRKFAKSLARYLFRQVHISALHRDREAFLNIAQSPHLACHVQTLVWGELTGKFGLLQDEHLRTDMDWGNPFDSGGPDLVDDLTSQVEPLFWLTPKCVGLESGKNEAIHALPFWDEFVDAVDKLPALRSFVSRPMHPDREVQSAADGYPLTVRVIQGFLHFTHDPGRTDDPTHPDTLFNLGFLFYLVPLLKLYTERGDQRPRQLCFSDEAVVGMSSLEGLRANDAPAFRHVHHLELKAFEQAIIQSRDTAGLEACLAEAVNLRHLHLRYVQTQTYGRENSPPQAPVFRSPLFAIPTLPSLVSLCLDNVVLERGYWDSPDSTQGIRVNREQPAFVDFIKRHAATLKRLCVVSSAVTEHSVRQLARIPNLKLDRFIMTGPFGRGGTFAEEMDILNFINWKYDCDSQGKTPPPQQANGPALVSLHGSKRTLDWETIEDAGSDESSGMGDDGGREICRTYDASSGLWVDEHGMYYDPATDQEMAEPRQQQQHGQPEGWQVQGNRTWDGELGLWRDSSSGHETYHTCLHKFAVDRAAADSIFDDNLDRRGEDDPDLQGPRDRAVDLPAYPPELCLLEEFEHQARRLGGPKWSFGTGPTGAVWYWQVLDDSPGYRTRIWHFTHRNGEEAYGADPLSFWADWEGGTSGDTATATPWCDDLSSFAKRAREDRLSNDTGASFPFQWEMGSKYGPPRLYHVSDDPGMETD